MCLILDNNLLGDFLNPKNKSMAPVRSWVLKGGAIVFSEVEGFRGEFNVDSVTIQRFKNSRRGINLIRIDDRTVSAKIQELNQEKYHKSNDTHIIALGLVSKAELLVTNDDKLAKDYKTIVRGKVYMTHSSGQHYNPKRKQQMLDRLKCRRQNPSTH